VYRIDSKESPEKVAKFLEKNPVAVPTLLDETGKVGRQYGIWAHPTSYLINRKGMVCYRAIGAVDWMSLPATSVIDHLLKEK
jgi:peroxiredoxin